MTGTVEVGFWYPEGNVRRGQEFELIAASAAKAGFKLVDESEPNWVFTDPSQEPINPHDATIFAWSQTSLAVGGSDQIYACYEDPMAKGGNYNGFCNDEATEALRDAQRHGGHRRADRAAEDRRDRHLGGRRLDPDLPVPRPARLERPV